MTILFVRAHTESIALTEVLLFLYGFNFWNCKYGEPLQNGRHIVMNRPGTGGPVVFGMSEVVAGGLTGAGQPLAKALYTSLGLLYTTWESESMGQQLVVINFINSTQ